MAYKKSGNASLPQHGGEGKGAYKKASNSSLPQHGGEGEAAYKSKKSGVKLLAMEGTDYCGPGRYL